MISVLVKGITAGFILADVMLLVLAGLPSAPVWTRPEVTSFTLEFTDTTGCDDVTQLSATPQVGQSVEISVISQGPEAGFAAVKIDDTNARLTCTLERLRDGATYSLYVRALDTTANEFEDLQLVIVASKTVQSDQRPFFVNPNPDPTSADYVITIQETAKAGDTVYFLSARDPDTATALLTYNIDNSDTITKDLFLLTGNRLSVQTGVPEGTFDYDKQGAVRQYPIVLELSDGSFTETLTTNIVVTDVNDNAPIFQNVPAQTVAESSNPGVFLFQVLATDADASTEFNNIKYSMTGSTDFDIGETTGHVFVSSGVSLDYGRLDRYTLNIKATDDVPGATLSTTTLVTVQIVTAPTFVNLASDTSVSISDASTVDTIIYALTVIDKDERDALSVTLESQTPDAMFRLDGYVLKPKPGVVFDANVQSTYKVTFRANDQINAVTSAILTVTIVNTGGTTSKPVVNPFHFRYLSENAPAGTWVADIDDTGLSSSNNVVFSMIGGESDFVLDTSTGIITVAPGVQLDYTATQSYSLIVTATDGVSWANTPVVVYIKTSPVFVDPANSSPVSTAIIVQENILPNRNIITLSATDEDGDELTYTILSQTPSTVQPVFDIVRDKLRTARTNTVDTLDVDSPNAVLEYQLQLQVTDGRLVSVNDTVDITITIVDSNEPPVFPVEEYPSQNILESTTEGTVVFTVAATDNDRTPAFRRIYYSVSGTTEFAIHPDTGDITVAIGTVFNQTDVPIYSFTVIATDGGVPAMTDIVYVTIIIVKDGCSMYTDEYGTWPVTKFGDTIAITCGSIYDGNNSRRCDENGIWGVVSSHCTVNEDVFKDLESQLEVLSGSTGDVSKDIEDISKNLTEITSTQTDSNGIKHVIDLSNDIVSIVETTKTVTGNSTEYFFETMSNIVKPENEEAWNATDREASAVLDIVDRYVAVLQEVQCNGLNDGDVDGIEKDHLYTEIGRKSGPVEFPYNKQFGSTISIPEETIVNTGLNDVCFGGSVYNSIGNILEKQLEKDGEITSFSYGQEVNSDVISIQLQTGMVNANLTPPISVTLSLLNGNLTDPVCVFWNFNLTNESGGKGAWSSDGCTLVNVTNTTVTCQCTHLTNFAILMSPSKISGKHAMILGIISAVGCAISMLCLVLTIVAHCIVWRIIRSNRTITLMNLCVALFLALAVFLTGVNRTESSAACAAIAAMIQYLFLTVFFLMLLTGFEILLSVVQVFGTKFNVTRLLPVAWLIPAVIVGVSMGVTKAEGYGNDEFCWLDIDTGIIWSFVGPVLFVIFVNVIFICVVFKKIASSKAMKSKSTKLKVMTNLRSLCVLLPVMGLSWILGIVSVNSDLFIFQYLFSILNSLQGVCIFLFHCVFNRQIRDALRRRKERRKTLEDFTSEFRHTKGERSKNFESDTTRQSNLGSQENGDAPSNRKNEELLLQSERK